MKKTFTRETSQYIGRHQLLEHGETYLVALSGGADSVALLLVLRELGYQVEACHCNFHLRGEESDRDERFCRELCRQKGVPFHVVHFDTHAYASLHHESIEMAARHLRYGYFDALRKDLNAAGICVAHHLDDSVETVLINLVRGTGIDGLTGIQPRNGYILRPLLSSTRADIIDYLESQRQSYVTDSSNLVADVVRNKIRLNIIPQLRDINPAAVNNIAQTSHHLAEAAKVLQAQTAQIKVTLRDGKIYLEKESLLQQPSLEHALFASLSQYGFTGSVVYEIMASINSTGKFWQSATHQLVIDRAYIILRPNGQASSKVLLIPETGVYVLDSEDHKLRVSRETSSTPSREPSVCTLDAAKLTFPLTLRPTQRGDRFTPFGMKGSKLVSDYLTDRKANHFDKQDARVVTDAKGEIVWLVGWRTAEGCKVTDTTKEVIKMALD